MTFHDDLFERGKTGHSITRPRNTAAKCWGIDIQSWTDIPTAILQAELAKRQDAAEIEKPACGSKTRGNYNTPIHVGALVLILVLSTLGMRSAPFLHDRKPI